MSSMLDVKKPEISDALAETAVYGVSRESLHSALAEIARYLALRINVILFRAFRFVTDPPVIENACARQ